MMTQPMEFTMEEGFDACPYWVYQNGTVIAKFSVKGDAARFLAMMKELYDFKAALT